MEFTRIWDAREFADEREWKTRVVSNGKKFYYGLVDDSGLLRVFSGKSDLLSWLYLGRRSIPIGAVFPDTDENIARLVKGLNAGLQASEINYRWHTNN